MPAYFDTDRLSNEELTNAYYHLSHLRTIFEETRGIVPSMVVSALAQLHHVVDADLRKRGLTTPNPQQPALFGDGEVPF